MVVGQFRTQQHRYVVRINPKLLSSNSSVYYHRIHKQTLKLRRRQDKNIMKRQQKSRGFIKWMSEGKLKPKGSKFFKKNVILQGKISNKIFKHLRSRGILSDAGRSHIECRPMMRISCKIKIGLPISGLHPFSKTLLIEMSEVSSSLFEVQVPLLAERACWGIAIRCCSPGCNRIFSNQPRGIFFVVTPPNSLKCQILRQRSGNYGLMGYFFDSQPIDQQAQFSAGFFFVSLDHISSQAAFLKSGLMKLSPPHHRY